MGKVFNLENPIWVFMGKVFDMLVLTILWVVTSIPLITMGASTTALYYVAMKQARNEEGYIIQQFFHSFKTNFYQATKVFVVILAIGVFLVVDLLWYYQFKNGLGVMIFFMFFILTVLYGMVITYSFPLLARCETNIKRIFAMAFIISIKNLGWTLLMMTTTVCILAIGIFICAPFLLLSIGLIAYIHGKILYIVLKQYQLVLS